LNRHPDGSWLYVGQSAGSAPRRPGASVTTQKTTARGYQCRFDLRIVPILRWFMAGPRRMEFRARFVADVVGDGRQACREMLRECARPHGRVFAPACFSGIRPAGGAAPREAAENRLKA